MKLYTNIQGEGDPLVFLHSGLQTGSSDFQKHAEHFSKSFKVIRPDLRGHGNSFSGDFTNYFEDAGEDLKETLDGLKLDSVHIAASSLGSLAALSFACKYPECVKSLTISGIQAVKPKKWSDMHRQEVDHQRKLLREEAFVQYFNQLHNTNWRELIYLSREENWYPFYLTKALPGIGVPTLYLAGEQNGPEVKAAHLFSGYDHIHTAVLPFAGHLVHNDQPEWYINLLERFLSEFEEY
ncbi:MULTISPECIES: alpha/beta hydrolase [unclassified Halobacillus]|uniref:alpha/beta fold hydrolase n=1 Tax=unclassified Halobacillus TaxID=2636472 RepID=UPI0002A4E239|nr:MULTISPECIES: alpha/beta hydrolase [unclassified Halobacillus]ELK46373.1 AB hydrolase superfamily protein [Halobacillus sp. BAB-2008]